LCHTVIAHLTTLGNASLKQFDDALTLSSNANLKGIVRVGVD
jgi:hypothetical protein